MGSLSKRIQDLLPTQKRRKQGRGEDSIYAPNVKTFIEKHTALGVQYKKLVSGKIKKKKKY